MLKHSALFVSILSLAGVINACGGSSDDDDGVPGSGASSSTGGTPNLGPLPGSGGSKLGPGEHDGGTEDLTPEDIEAIEGGACAGWTTEGEALPAVLMLVVDVSGSMESQAPGSNQSKWAITHDALSTAIDRLGAETAVGVLYYPNQNTGQSNGPTNVDACVNTDELLPIAPLGPPGSPGRDAMQQSLDDANTGGGTPTHDAYQYALENGMQNYQSSAEKFMLLITDGQPTFLQGCDGTGMVTDPVDEQPIVAAIAAAAQDGIRTFVIGSPGSESNQSTGDDARPWLSQAAEAGQTAAANCSHDGSPYCHMDMTEEPNFAEALAAGLGAIVGQISSCTYVIPPPPDGQEINLAEVNLIVTTGGQSQLIKPDDMGSCTEGWQFNADNQIVLCDATCQRVQEDGGASVKLLFGCASGTIDPPK
jgi:hypothetical protein